MAARLDDHVCRCFEAPEGVTSELEQLRGRMEHRTRALAAVTHDLRRPLTRMRLRIEALDAVTRRGLATDVAEMEALIAGALNALCEVASSEPPEWIEPNQLLAQLRDDFRRMGGALDVHGAAAPYFGRPLSLRRCLSNLIENALKFGGAASICVSDGAELRIVVRDGGPGIPDAELERVFEPFYRARSARRASGAGLGLWIAREAAAAHGGRLVLRNHARGGAEAELSLPRDVAPTVTFADASMLASGQVRPALASVRGAPHVALSDPCAACR